MHPTFLRIFVLQNVTRNIFYEPPIWIPQWNDTTLAISKMPWVQQTRWSHGSGLIILLTQFTLENIFSLKFFLSRLITSKIILLFSLPPNHPKNFPVQVWLSNHASRFHIASNLAMLIPYSRSNGRLFHLSSIVGGGQIFVSVPILLLLPCFGKKFYEAPSPILSPSMKWHHVCNFQNAVNATRRSHDSRCH